jgi:hypothetical protein
MHYTHPWFKYTHDDGSQCVVDCHLFGADADIVIDPDVADRFELCDADAADPPVSEPPDEKFGLATFVPRPVDGKICLDRRFIASYEEYMASQPNGDK